MVGVIEKLSLFVLILLVALRPLIPESYDSAGSHMTAALRAIGDPSPLATLIMDLLILLAFGGWLFAWSTSPTRRYRRTGIEWGLAIVGLAAVVSCLVAGNKRLAINASIDWLCYPLITIALVQLMHRGWHRRLLLAAVLASACAQSVKCLEDHFIAFDQTAEYYQDHREEIWARQHVDLDSARVELFEHRMQAREVSGFFPHSNVAGAYLVLCGLAGIAVAVTRWRHARDAAGRLIAAGATLGAVLIISSAAFTKSTGAIVSAIAGVTLWACVAYLRNWINTHRAKAVLVGWLCVVVGGLAVVGHGLYHGSLPNDSLNFRWQYWRASSELIAEHGLTGVGRENFDRHYLEYKPIDAPEEIDNPHNLFVQAASDWGFVGLIGIVAMLVGGSLAVTLPRASQQAKIGSSHDARGRSTIWIWGILLALGVFVARVPLIGTVDPNFLYYTTVTLGLPWLLAFLLFSGDFGDRGEWTITTGIAVGLFAFLLHDMINFAAFVPGSATTLFALLAFCVADRSGGEASTPNSVAGPTVAALLAVVALLVVLFVGVIPVARASYLVSQADKSQRNQPARAVAPGEVDRHYAAAVSADPWDPTPCVERARWWVRVAAAAPDRRIQALQTAAESIRQAVARDPAHTGVARIQVRILESLATETGKMDDYLQAVEAARHVARLYPADPAAYVLLADCLLEAGAVAARQPESDAAEQPLREAISNYRRALQLDDSRPEWERIRGFRDRQRRAITAGTQRAEELLQALRK